MTDWGFPNFDRHLDPDLYDPQPEGPVQTHAPVEKCRGCGSLTGPFNYFNGWPWCSSTCYKQITALAMANFPHAVTEEDAIEHFQQRRR